MSTEFESTWATYTAAWKAGSDAERQALLGRAVQPDCHYADPLVQVEGHQALSAYMVDLQRQVPGVHFVTRASPCTTAAAWPSGTCGTGRPARWARASASASTPTTAACGA